MQSTLNNSLKPTYVTTRFNKIITITTTCWHYQNYGNEQDLYEHMNVSCD